MDSFLTQYFPEFVVASCIGFLFGFVLHGLLRAPRWLVERLAE